MVDWGFVRRVIATIYIIVICFIIVVGFAYSNQDDARLRENYFSMDNGWTNNGVDVVFPYANKEEFVIENTLCKIADDNMYLAKKRIL